MGLSSEVSLETDQQRRTESVQRKLHVLQGLSDSGNTDTRGFPIEEVQP